MAGRYNFEFENSKRLEQAMSKIPDESERLVNTVLHKDGTRMMIDDIVGFVNIGARPSKSHAKLSKPLNANTFNLGFKVYTKGGAANNPGSFGYLVFPDEGRGVRNPVAQKFVEKGSQKAHKKIMGEVIEAVETAHEKLIGG